MAWGEGFPEQVVAMSPKQGFPGTVPLPLEVSWVPVRPRTRQPSPGMVPLNPGTENPLMGCAGLFSLCSAFCFVAVTCLEHLCQNAGSGLGMVKSKSANPVPRQGGCVRPWQEAEPLTCCFRVWGAELAAVDYPASEA